MAARPGEAAAQFFEGAIEVLWRANETVFLCAMRVKLQEGPTQERQADPASPGDPSPS